MASEHGVTAPNPLLYPPAPKKPKKKRSKGSPKEGAAGMKSMPSDGSCAYHLASMAMYATAHPDKPDIEHWPTEAGSARSAVVDNYLGMRDQLLEYLKKIPEEHRSSQLSQWENLVSEHSAESFIEAAIDEKEWGGAIELAIAMNASTTGIIIVQAALISEDANDVDVQGAVQPAMLEGLVDGAAKTHNVFAILSKDHYHLGYVKTGGVDRGLFKVGDESDAAKISIIEFLKRLHKDTIKRKRKRVSGKPLQESCISDEEEPKQDSLVSGNSTKRKRKRRGGKADNVPPKNRKGRRVEPDQVSCASDDEPREKQAAEGGKLIEQSLESRPQQVLRISDDEELSVSDHDEPRGKAVALGEGGKLIAQFKESGPVSDAYDKNQMIIYTSEDEPNVLLVGAVMYEGVFETVVTRLEVHRYGYVAKAKASWELNYKQSFRPAYQDPQDKLNKFTFRPPRGYDIVQHDVSPSNVKAKFELTTKHQVPINALNGTKTTALNTTVQAGQPTEYERTRLKRIQDNEAVLLSFGVLEAKNNVNSKPVAAKTKKVKAVEEGPRRRSARLSAAARGGDNGSHDAAHPGKLSDYHSTRNEIDECKIDEEDEEDEEDEGDEEDEEDEV